MPLFFSGLGICIQTNSRAAAAVGRQLKNMSTGVSIPEMDSDRQLNTSKNVARCAAPCPLPLARALSSTKSLRSIRLRQNLDVQKQRDLACAGLLLRTHISRQHRACSTPSFRNTRRDQSVAFTRSPNETSIRLNFWASTTFAGASAPRPVRQQWPFQGQGWKASGERLISSRSKSSSNWEDCLRNNGISLKLARAETKGFGVCRIALRIGLTLKEE